MNENKFKVYSVHFWTVLKKGEKFFKKIPKRTSSTISFSIDAGSHINGTYLDIVELENILMRLRVFISPKEPIFLEKLLSDFMLEYPQLKDKIEIINNNLTELKNWKLSINLTLNGKEYENIFEIIKYILHGSLLHSDSKKREHLENLFSNQFIGSLVYYEIIDWILGYIRYVLFEFDLLVQNYLYKNHIERDEYFKVLSKYLEFIDPVEVQLK